MIEKQLQRIKIELKPTLTESIWERPFSPDVFTNKTGIIKAAYKVEMKRVHEDLNNYSHNETVLIDALKESNRTINALKIIIESIESNFPLLPQEEE